MFTEISKGEVCDLLHLEATTKQVLCEGLLEFRSRADLCGWKLEKLYKLEHFEDVIFQVRNCPEREGLAGVSYFPGDISQRQDQRTNSLTGKKKKKRLVTHTLCFALHITCYLSFRILCDLNSVFL